VIELKAKRWCDSYGRYWKTIHIDSGYVGKIPTTHFTPAVKAAIQRAYVLGRQDAVYGLLDKLPKVPNEWVEEEE